MMIRAETQGLSFNMWSFRLSAASVIVAGFLAQQGQQRFYAINHEFLRAFASQAPHRHFGFSR